MDKSIVSPFFLTHGVYLSTNVRIGVKIVLLFDNASCTQALAK